jgi:transposase-like protein
MHRIRFAMAADPRPPKLRGKVEADETYVGGKPRGRRPGYRRRTTKTPVMAMVERGGKVRAMPLERVTAANVRKLLLANVAADAKIFTDEASVYQWLGKPWPGGHEAVNHSAGEYARGDATTNTVEGFFSILKRGIYGTFHSVSKKHLHRYVDEFAFRYNTRGMDDGERTLGEFAAYLRDLVAEACPYANICEQCDNFVTTAEFAPALDEQLADVRALHDDATERGWHSEVARHARVIASIEDHLRRLNTSS